MWKTSIRFQKKKSGTQDPLKERKGEPKSCISVHRFFLLLFRLSLESLTSLKLEDEEVYSLPRMTNRKNGFDWVSLNQNQSCHSSQSQRRQTKQRADHNTKKLCSRCKAREDLCERVTINFGFTSDWPTKWPEIFKPIAKRSSYKQMWTASDTQVKIDVLKVKLLGSNDHLEKFEIISLLTFSLSLAKLCLKLASSWDCWLISSSRFTAYQ